MHTYFQYLDLSICLPVDSTRRRKRGKNSVSMHFHDKSMIDLNQTQLSVCVFVEMCNNFSFIACSKQINISPFWCVLSRLLWTRQQLRTKLYNRLTISIWALKFHEGEIFYFSFVVGYFRRIHCFSHFFPVFEQEEFSRKCILKNYSHHPRGKLLMIIIIIHTNAASVISMSCIVYNLNEPWFATLKLGTDDQWFFFFALNTRVENSLFT